MPGLVKHLYTYLLLLGWYAVAYAQAPLTQVKGLPSSEIYDLFTDSKGFLWITHNAGISKYDGISFTSFSNPQQSSLSTTGLLEDKHGRIWFNNFTGQIFYIENGHMNLLDAYKSADENYFPQIGIFHDLLVATTKKGLFICNTNTLKCHYEKFTDPHSKGTTSLSILKDKVIAYGYGDWYIYQPEKGLKRAAFEDKDHALIKYNSSLLGTRSYNDTAFLYINPANLLYKLVVVNDTVKVCDRKQSDGFINTVSITSNQYWVNTINSSIGAPGGNNILKGYNLSSVAVDKEGHHWYGSLQQGLLTDTVETTGGKNVIALKTDNKNVIKCLIKTGHNILFGTQNGNLLSYDTYTGKTTLIASLQSKLGGINYLKQLDNNHVWVGSSIDTYVLDLNNNQLSLVPLVRSLKQATEAAGATFFASSNSLIILPHAKTPGDYEQWKNAFSKKIKGLIERKDSIHSYFTFEKRCRAICYSSATETIWLSVKDGLYTINSRGLKPFYLDNTPVYASCLTSHLNKVIAGTFNNGVYIIENNKVKHLALDDGLFSNNILHVKIIADNLWVYTSGSVQIFDLHSFKLVNKYPIPGINELFLTDADELEGKCYLASLNNLYAISPSAKSNDRLNIYLNSLSINRKDTGSVNNIVLHSSQNDIQISLGTPYLLNARDIFIKYRLKRSDSSRWVYGRPGERNIHYASLMPGSYRFEAYAVKLQTGALSPPFVLNFIILEPWWQTWWCRTILIFIFLLTIILFLKEYYAQKLDEQKIQYEKVLIAEKERQHISREIHDNIGQALSVIKLNLNMGGTKQIAQTKELVNEVIYDLRQFTHGLHQGKLLTGSLTETINKDIERLNINDELTATIEIEGNSHIIDQHHEFLIYRIFQESINNILKHAQAKNISVRIINNDSLFKLTITDDGKGFFMRKIKRGLGFDNMYKRAEMINGDLCISGKPSKGSTVELIIDHESMSSILNHKTAKRTNKS